ncbi:MAG: zf-TFIIB domain-containing protein [Candidatus Wallbacteria bacterium]|nr:zf-TFIIB domain-containing protein [Candidatus Wallbacteria bacterium]
MDCPVCSKAMTTEDFGGVQVDVCQNCGGIWFDMLELRKLDEPAEGSGPAMEKALSAALADDTKRSPISCPYCKIGLKRHKYQFNKDVTIDECYECGGIFLDAGELKLIKQGFMDQEKRARFCENLLRNIPEYEQSLEEQRLRQEKLGKLFRVIDKVNPDF